MAKPLKFNLKGKEYDLSPVKLERSKLKEDFNFYYQ
jgi:hypothetical protein